MDVQRVLFWNVDTQIDFINPEGKLYVSGAEKLKPVWAKITRFAKTHQVRVINTMDYHYINSAELSVYPDFQKSFPQHCMAGTSGARYIEETIPECPVIFEWDKTYHLHEDFDDPVNNRNIVIRKDAFDVFEGNCNTENLLKYLNPDKIFVYGVTTNVCVDKAVVGLANRGYHVFVLEDAIKELSTLPLPFKAWDQLGVKRIRFAEIEQYL